MRSSRPPKSPAEVRAPKSSGLQAAQQAGRHAAQEVRIIGGQWKRTPLAVPVSAGLRPTPSRVRETLFNWLGQDLSGWTILDAFAGSGALGLEAASRGASSVTLIEREPALAHSIRASIDKLKAQNVVRLIQTDALSWMGQAARQHTLFDLVFLDPPFETDAFEAAVQAAVHCVPPGGWIYLEASKPFAATAFDDLTLAREGKAGAVHFHLFQRKAEPTAGA